jgi:DNA-directed RNA polymerase subunit M/transcription elongation factor TFIIS
MMDDDETYCPECGAYMVRDDDQPSTGWQCDWCEYAPTPSPTPKFTGQLLGRGGSATYFIEGRESSWEAYFMHRQTRPRLDCPNCGNTSDGDECRVCGTQQVYHPLTGKPDGYFIFNKHLPDEEGG